MNKDSSLAVKLLAIGWQESVGQAGGLARSSESWREDAENGHR
jgi:hypothetical protein